VLDGAAAGGEHAAGNAARARLAVVLGFDAICGAAHGGFYLAWFATAKQTAV
jgi:hypothetical protein